MARTRETSDVAPGDGSDPLRERLLEAAAHVFAEKGYSGTKVMDIVKAAGLSSGAMYGRFDSKNELLIEAVITRAVRNASASNLDERQVADVIAQFAVERQGPLSDAEASQLEAYATARREPDVASAIGTGQRRRRKALQPMVDKALADGTVAPDADIESILYFFDTMRLGLLLQRAARVAPPSGKRWNDFVRRLLHSLADESQTRKRGAGRRR